MNKEIKNGLTIGAAMAIAGLVVNYGYKAYTKKRELAMAQRTLQTPYNLTPLAAK